MAASLFSGIAAFGAYLLLAGTVSVHEAAAGVAVGVGIGLWSVAARRASPRRFAFSPHHLCIWMRTIAGLLGAVLRTGAAMMAPDRMTAVERRFRQGAQDDPAERARRATALLAASLAPASFVVRADPGEATVLIHAVRGARLPDDAEWLR